MDSNSTKVETLEIIPTIEGVVLSPAEQIIELEEQNPLNPRPGRHAEIDPGWTAPLRSYAGPGNNVSIPEFAESLGDLIAWFHDWDYTYSEVNPEEGRPSIHGVNKSDEKMVAVLQELAKHGQGDWMDHLSGKAIQAKQVYSRVNDWWFGDEPIKDEWNAHKQQWVGQNMDRLGVGPKGREMMKMWNEMDPNNESQVQRFAGKISKWHEEKTNPYKVDRKLFTKSNTTEGSSSRRSKPSSLRFNRFESVIGINRTPKVKTEARYQPYVPYYSTQGRKSSFRKRTRNVQTA